MVERPAQLCALGMSFITACLPVEFFSTLYICFGMRVISLNWAWWLHTGSLCTCICLLHFL